MLQHMILLIYNVQSAQETTVNIKYGETKQFPFGKNLVQGCVLAPYLLNQDVQHIIQKTGLDSNEEVKTGGRNLNNLR